MTLMDFVCHMRLSKVSMQIKSGPMPHFQFSEQDVTRSFYSEGPLAEHENYRRNIILHCFLPDEDMYTVIM